MSELKLHIGCGKRFIKGFVHIDGADFEHIDYKDVTKLPYKDNSIDLIYASHLLEYFNQDEVKNVLKEWHRVLKPGGKLRLAVPDFGAMNYLYYQNKIPLSSFIGPLYGRMQMGDKYIYHKMTYDFISLRDLLTEMKFTDIDLWDWHYTEHAGVDDCSRSYIPHDLESIKKMEFDNHTLISLNVECKKA